MNLWAITILAAAASAAELSATHQYGSSYTYPQPHVHNQGQWHQHYGPYVNVWHGQEQASSSGGSSGGGASSEFAAELEVIAADVVELQKTMPIEAYYFVNADSVEIDIDDTNSIIQEVCIEDESVIELFAQVSTDVAGFGEVFMVFALDGDIIAYTAMTDTEDMSSMSLAAIIKVDAGSEITLGIYIS